MTPQGVKELMRGTFRRAMLDRQLLPALPASYPLLCCAPCSGPARPRTTATNERRPPIAGAPSVDAGGRRAVLRALGLRGAPVSNRLDASVFDRRSEERRVGKSVGIGCRCRQC